MPGAHLIIDGRQTRVPAGTTILEAARDMGIHIPCLCGHPDLPPAGTCRASAAVYQGSRRIAGRRPGEPAAGCGLCLVEISGRPDPVAAGSMAAAEGMVVTTAGDRLRARRQAGLAAILKGHPHACLTCAQREGCSRTTCTAGVPEEERCCPLLGRCELQAVALAIGIPADLPAYRPQGLPVIEEEDLIRDCNLCIGCTRCVRACEERGGGQVLGFVYEEGGRIRVGTRAPTLEASGCRFCRACAEVCPTGALRDRAAARGKAVGHSERLPPAGARPLEAREVRRVPAAGGVYRLFGAGGRALVIKGVPNLRAALLAELERTPGGLRFDCEEDKLYSQRESELLQGYLQAYGEMPGREESEWDDLY